MSETIKEFLVFAAMVSVIFLLGFGTGRRTAKGCHSEPVKEKVDTMVIRDTITITEAVSVTRRVIDSVFVPVTDTLTLHDTLYVVMERDQIRWEDSLSVVYASGINPQVDSVRHMIQEMVVTKEIPVIEVKRTRWGVGVQGGYGIGKDGLTPWIGVGVSYNLLSW